MIEQELQEFKNIASDLKEVSATVEVKKEDIEKEVERLIGSGNLSTSLLNVAHGFIPKVDQARKFLEQMRTQAPLLSMLSVGIVESDGHTSANVGSLDEDPEGRLHRQLGQTIGFYQPFLALTLERLREKYKPSIDEILKFLHESPLFVDADKGLLREGLEAYEKEDFVKAIHVLVPPDRAHSTHLSGCTGRSHAEDGAEPFRNHGCQEYERHFE